MIGSLDGVRVVDITTNVSGPFATQILGDLGADVIKVERPGGGDDTRTWGPPFYDDERTLSATFASLNRNKRSLCLDLKNERDQRVLDRLIASSDVLVQNMRAGAFERLGYSWDRLRTINPKLIYCEMTGFGHRGPMSSFPAYDPLMQAFSGLMSLIGEEGRPPVRVPVSILDKGTGMWAAIGVLNGLLRRGATGVGYHLRTSLLETALKWEPLQLMGYVADGTLPRRYGSGIGGIAPYQAFQAADGYMIVAAGNQRLWETLCDAVGRPELLADPRFADNSSRSEHREALADELTRTFQADTVASWVAQLEARGLPVTPIHDVGQAVDHPQVQAMGMIDQIHRPDGPPLTTVHLPMWVDEERMDISTAPPAIGADTRAVLRELGCDEVLANEICADHGILETRDHQERKPK